MESPPTNLPLSTEQSEWATFLVSVGLYAITCMQTHIYAVRYSRQDGTFIKLIVVYLWIMDTIHVVLNNRAMWILVRHPGAPNHLSKEIAWGGLFTALVSCPVQVFFVLRIRKLLGRMDVATWIVLVVLVLASVFQLAGYIAFLILALNGVPSIAGLFAIQKLPEAFWGVGAAEDAIISILFLWILWKDSVARKMAGQPSFTSRSTHRLLKRVSIVGLNTGLWTTACALATTLTLRLVPRDTISTGLYIILGPLYCNTFLANLNGRGFVRGDDYDVVSNLAPSRAQLSQIVPSTAGGSRTVIDASGSRDLIPLVEVKIGTPSRPMKDI